ncbi:MAG: rhodanese-like domain-containing protein, partial [Rhodospirillaceae bacterium]
MTYAKPEALVTSDWLADRLDDPDTRIVDASYFVPGGVAPARTQYEEAHIPGAIFFDINDIAAPSTVKDHAFPTPEIFADKVGRMGIGND